MVQLGDISDTDYQAAIALSAYGDGAPYLTFYQGIDSYSLSGKDVFTLAYDRQKKECYLKNFGRAYIGAKDESSYISFDPVTNRLKIRAELDVLPNSQGMELFNDSINFSQKINNSINNGVAKQLGYKDWEDMTVTTADKGTIIKDGLINTELLFANEINANQAVIRNLSLLNARVSGNIYTPMTVIREDNWRDYLDRTNSGDGTDVAYINWKKTGLNVQINYWPDLVTKPGTSVGADVLRFPVGEEFLGCEANVLFLTEGNGRTSVGMGFLYYNTSRGEFSHFVNGFLGLGFYKLRLIDCRGFYPYKDYDWLLQSFQTIEDLA